MKMVATNFATWMEDNAWTAVYSEELKKRAWVDASKEKILLHGSDYHFTTLVKECGKSLDELYEMFLIDERRRLKTLNKAHVSGQLPPDERGTHPTRDWG